MTTKVNISEWERMISGRLYSPADPEIAKRHRAGMIRCDRFNRIPLWRGKAKQRALERLIPSAKGKNFEAFAPFYCAVLTVKGREHPCGAELLRQLQQRVS